MQNFYLIYSARVTVCLAMILYIQSVCAQTVESDKYLNKQLKSESNDTVKAGVLLKLGQYYVNKKGSEPDDIKQGERPKTDENIKAVPLPVNDPAFGAKGLPTIWRTVI